MGDFFEGLRYFQQQLQRALSLIQGSLRKQGHCLRDFQNWRAIILARFGMVSRVNVAKIRGC